jgi:hypothetical protein
MKGIVNATGLGLPSSFNPFDGSFTVKSKIVLPLGDGGECALSEYPTTCAICGGLIKNVHESHNPCPIAPPPHRCCTTCNVTQVLPARIKKLGVYSDGASEKLDILNPKVLEAPYEHKYTPPAAIDYQL